MEVATDDSVGMFRGRLDADATFGRCGEVANGLLIQALQDLAQSAHHTNDHCSHMLDCWSSELENVAEMVCQGEKGLKYMLLLNNTFGVLQIMKCQAASFSNEEIVSRLNSMIQRYKTRYLAECWVPLKDICRLNLDEFTAKFLATCDNQRAWKVKAEFRYELRQEIKDLIVPAYEFSLSALQANGSPLSRLLCSFIGKKKQKRYTGEELAEEIRALFEG